MSNHYSRPAARPTPAARPSTDRPTATYPTSYPGIPARRSIRAAAAPARPFAGWRGQAQTEELPVIGGSAHAHLACGASRSQSHDRAVARRPRRHLRAALAGLALAAILLGALQAYAAAGISSARQAALAAASAGSNRTEQASAPQSDKTEQAEEAAPSPMSGQSDVRSDIQNVRSDWVTQDTGAPYDRTNPHASPLRDLPRCTTSPDTPMPCLAHVSADSRRAVVLEEDASLTALVRR